MDEDAGLVISLKLPQLSATHKLVRELAPGERQAINLAGLGASAILGFYPFDTNAWSASGFDTKSPLILQLAASRRDPSPSRTRAILKARGGGKARRTIEGMRLQQKARTKLSKEQLTPLFAGVAEMPSEDSLRAQLTAAGVFLVARPRPLEGLLFAQERDGFIVIDIFAPGTNDFATVLQAVKRRPSALDVSMVGAGALAEGPIGIWIRAAKLANTIERVPAKESKRRKACGRLASLGRNSSIDSIGVRINVERKALSLSSKWHLRPVAGLARDLRVATDPVLAGQELLDAQIHLASWGTLRDRERPPHAKDWDALWADSKSCGPSSKMFVGAVAWPEILGLFLSEISVLDPTAASAIDGLRGVSAQVGAGEKGSVRVTTEAWVEGPAASVAKGWLRTLFGSEHIEGKRYRWGHGAIRPYAIDGEAGSIVGAGYREGSREMALSKARGLQSQVAKSTEDGFAVLGSVKAKPSKLVSHLPTIPGAALWKAWKEASAVVQNSSTTVEFNISLRR